MITAFLSRIYNSTLNTEVSVATDLDQAKALYLVASLVLGGLGAMASLLGSEKPMEKRVIGYYILSGSLVSLGVVLLLIDQYGFSYFLVGVSIFAGYKAFDVLAIVGVALTQLLRKFFKNRK